jgi:hypothetical protein
MVIVCSTYRKLQHTQSSLLVVLVISCLGVIFAGLKSDKQQSHGTIVALYSLFTVIPVTYSYRTASECAGQPRSDCMDILLYRFICVMHLRAFYSCRVQLLFDHTFQLTTLAMGSTKPTPSWDS